MNKVTVGRIVRNTPNSMLIPMLFSIIPGIILGLMLSTAGFVHADAKYPITSPAYVPMAQTASVTLATGASTTTYMTLNNINVVVMRVSGTCTGLAAAVQVTNDVGATKTNWTSVNFWPSPALGTAAGTIDADGSLTATGLYKIKTDGMTMVRLNVSALTGASCAIQFTGSNSAFTAAYW